MPIRTPTLHESYRVVQLMDQSLRSVDTAYDTLTRTWLRRWLARFVTLPPYFHWLNEGWIAEEAGDITGWLYLLHHSRCTHINDLGVAPSHRRQGWGQRLLAWAKQRAHEQGKSALTLAVTVRNAPAVQIYEGNGYRALHHTLWEGWAERLPGETTSLLRLREVDPPQREAPFHKFWGRALTSDGHDAGPLLADQAKYWFTARGNAWELWQGQQCLGYADLVAGVLRLFLDTPTELSLRAAWGALRRLLPPGPLLLDLGSDLADASAREILDSSDWKLTRRERMLMVRTAKT